MTNVIYKKGDFIIRGNSIIGLKKSGYKKLVSSNVLEIPTIQGVQAIGSNFIERAYANDITSLYINEGIEYIEEDAFSLCPVEKVHFPESLKKIGRKAFCCSGLLELYIPKNVVDIGMDAFSSNPLRTADFSDSSITTLEYGLFDGCRDLESVKLPNKLTTILDNAFLNNSSLTDITFPESLVYIYDSAFETSGLTRVHIEGDSELEYIRANAFSGSKLEELDFSKLRNLKTIEPWAFGGVNLKEVNIKHNVGVYEGAFYRARVKTLVVNAELEETEKGIFEESSFCNVFINSTTIPEETFKNAYIKNIKFKNVKKISKSAFEGVVGLELNIPDDVELY